MKKILFLFVAGIFLGGTVCVPQSGAQFLPMFKMAHPLEGKQAPDFTLDTTRRIDVNFEKYRDGKPAILFFWTTWCPHCRRQIQELFSRLEELNKKGIKLLLIDLQEESPYVAGFLKKNDVDFETFLDLEGEVAEAYHVMGVPTFFLVAGDGTIRKVDHILPEAFDVLLTEKIPGFTYGESGTK